MSNEYPREYGQQDVTVINRVLSNIQANAAPELQITIPRTLPSEANISQNSDSASMDNTHSHRCDCGGVFTCEAKHCGPRDEPRCEHCEVWSKQTFGQCEHYAAPIEAYFAGDFRRQKPGGHAGFGALIRVNGKVVYSNSGYCGHGPSISTNLGAYWGAVDAVTEALKYNSEMHSAWR